MKYHVPTPRVRTVPAPNGATSPADRPVEKRSTFRYILAISATIGLLLAIALADASYRNQVQSLNDLCSQSESELAQLRLEIAAAVTSGQQLQDQVSLHKAERGRLEELLKTARKQIDDSQSANGATKSLMEQILEQVQRIVDDRKAAAKRADQAQSDLKILSDQHYAQQLATASILAGDPRLARKVLDEAIVFATSAGIDSEEADRQIATLATTADLPVGATVTVHDVYRDGSGVRAFVSVTDISGRFIENLSRVDFEIHNDNKRLHLVGVAAVHQNDRAHECVLLLDNSGSMTGGPHLAMQNAACDFVLTLANPSRLRVFRFDNDVIALSPWTTDAELHNVAIRQLSPDGGTALYKAVRLAFEDLRTRQGSRSIVLFTDGSDSFNNEDIEPTLDACREHHIAIHVLALTTAEINEPLLRHIADETHGLFLAAPNPTLLAEQFRSVARAFQRPVYRLSVFEPVDDNSLMLQVGTLPAVALSPRQANVANATGT